MAKSISQLQRELVNSGALNELGSSSKNYLRSGELPTLERFLIETAANFILKVKENIETLGISDTGALSDDLSEGELEKSSKGYSITMGYPANSKAAKYYDFVNKGVKGVKSGTPNSPYAFKNLGVSRAMLSNIYSWVNRNGLRKNDVAITKRQAKRQSLSKMISEASKKKSLAYAIAVNIKKKGLKQTKFFDNAVDNYFKNFAPEVAKVIGQDVKVLIYGNNN